MSKKELLERMARPTDAKARPAAAPGVPPVAPPASAPAAGGAGGPGTTRVSGRVVRRRAANPGEEEVVAPPPTPVVRRRAVDLAGKPEVEERREPVVEYDEPSEPHSERTESEQFVSAPRVEQAPVEERAPVVEAAPREERTPVAERAPEPPAVAAEPAAAPIAPAAEKPAPAVQKPAVAASKPAGNAPRGPTNPPRDPGPSRDPAKPGAPRPQPELTRPRKTQEPAQLISRGADRPAPKPTKPAEVQRQPTRPPEPSRPSQRSSDPVPQMGKTGGDSGPRPGARTEPPRFVPRAVETRPSTPRIDRTVDRNQTPAARQAPGPREADRSRPPSRDGGPSASAGPSGPGEKGPTERPRFEGLGPAVVVPPPGYDPTNPGAFRRRVEQRPAPMGGRPGPGQNQGPGGPGHNQGPGNNQGPGPGGQDFDRRRQGAGPGPGEPMSEEERRRQRRSRSTAAMGGGDGGLAMRRRPRRKAVGGAKPSSPAMKASKRKIRIDNVISVGQLAHELGVKAAIVIKELMGMGRMATVNELLDLDTAQVIATEFEFEVVNAGFQEDQFLQQVTDSVEEEGAIDRPPVVTIMGHVDHGKTTLLDALRSAKVAAGEAGGITQHIGAYQVDLKGDKITFIDTPGHAAFTAMRARGAGITDIVILVVAADDGVQAQTEEAINHAKAAGVPIIVAVNKMDKPGVSADPIKQRLADYGLLAEDWGGETMYVPVSALKKQGLEELLEAVLLQAEVLELRANPDRHAEGTVIEARLERGRGAVATLLVQKGTLKRGDNIVLGSSFGRVRAMMDHNGKQVKEAGPATPVEIFGLSELPETGDAFAVVKNEKDARTLAEHRAGEKRQSGLSVTGRRTAADIFASAEATEKKVLGLILKTDVQGSLEALKLALSQVTVKGTELRILSTGVGDISESDVNLARADGSLLIGFNVKVDAMARQAADQHDVKPELYDIIYAVIDRVTSQMSGLLGPQYREVKMGNAEVRAVFAISKVGKIAGCVIHDGKIARSHTIRITRKGEKIFEGKVSTLKRFKEDVREVGAGYECGLGIEGFDEMQVGDEIESFAREQINIGA